ncbi:MAG: adenine deaminase [Tenericutes bacterium GWC2_39_45]|nr:MAG: adenine deaminase [Tenericutes bacterium GWC2_39_45]OHE32673.1 MAG: adenine deaminase [Tenericutes bacterium GWD2_38_27]HBG33689.1 adenine deaminase [Acholeplasmataceae bacterium]HCB66810.1 adenine deaminase [Acholeplasmataceae bacterium]
MNYKSIMKKARGEQKASLVLKNGRIINVYSGEIEELDIAIEDGKIIGIGTYNGIKEIDLKKMYVAPGLIDGHVHIESSMLTPPQFAKIVLPKGTTTIIADPHEIANVSGVPGIEFMLKSSEHIPLSVYMMIPSCVPATIDENAGAMITAHDIKKLKKHPRVLGLGEVMDYPSVIQGNTMIFEKIKVMNHHMIDGHAPDVIGNDLNAYITAGVMTDHECTMVISMQERIKRGMYVHLREGSATRNTKTLLKGLNKNNIHRVLFCTDDKHPEDIKNEGHINYNVNLAIEHGIDPIDAIRMATINAANCYHLPNIGGIAPGKDADLIIFDSLKKIEPLFVYKKGVLVASHGKALFEASTEVPDAVLNTVHLDLDQLSFSLQLKSNQVKVIGLIQNNITTHLLNRTVNVTNNQFVYDKHADILKLAVIERHHNKKLIGIGLVEGFGFKNGALAMTIAHDSHNLIIVGSSDDDMRLAAEKINEIQGGIVLVRNGKVVHFLKLEVGGIMTNAESIVVSESLKYMKKEIKDMGLDQDIDDPFISLAFLALPVIPTLKLTDRGLFDVNQFKIVLIENQ